MIIQCRVSTECFSWIGSYLTKMIFGSDFSIGFVEVLYEMRKGLRSGGTNTIVTEKINRITRGSKLVKGVVTDNVVDGDKKENGLDINTADSVLNRAKDVVIAGDKKENGLDINAVNSVSKTTNGPVMDDINLGLGNSDLNVIDGNNNNKRLNIDLNEFDSEKMEVDSRPGNGKVVVRLHESECITVDGDIRNNNMDLVPKQVDGVDDSLDGKIEECNNDNLENVGTSRDSKDKFAKVSEKKRKADNSAKGNIDDNADPDIDTTTKVKKKGRPPKRRRMKKNVDANVESEVVISVPRKKMEKVSIKKIKMVSTSKEKDNVNDCPDIHTSVQKMKLRRFPKQIRVESNVNANVETAIVTSGPRNFFEKIPKKKRNATSSFKRKVNVTADSVIYTTIPQKKRGRPRKDSTVEGDSIRSPKKNKKSSTSKGKIIVNAVRDRAVKRKRGRPPKERKVDNTVEERVGVNTCVKKGSDGDEERELGGERGEYSGSKNLEFGEDADGSDHGDKHMGKVKFGKGKMGRKRKIVGSQVVEFDKGACKKKAKRTSSDGDIEKVVRVLRSQNNKVDEKITGNMKDERAHFSDRKNKKLKGLQDGPSRVHGHPEKPKKSSVAPISKKVNYGERSSDGEAEEIVLKRPNSKKDEEGEVKRSVKKKLLKDRITKMLISAGWTIEHKPRIGRNYCDSIYVCPRGRGYWSVTRAYRVLKQEVENEEADSRAVSAFVPIPVNEWNSLLRITQPGIKMKSNKSKKVKDQSAKVISPKKISKKKHLKERERLRLKHRQSLKRFKKKEREKKKRCTLLVRGSKKGGDLNSEDILLYEGKRSLLSWMIDLGTLSLGVKVKCMNSRKTTVLREGKVTKDGIHCACCNKSLSLADFETHSGSSLGQPLQNIYLDSKTSLLQCLSESLCKYEENVLLGFHSVSVDGDDPNDDTCNMCGDGGNLICCDSCPSAIHQKCLNIQKFPTGEWNCNYCTCKFCGMIGVNTRDKDQNDVTSYPTLPTCCLCEEKYHPLCVEGKDASHSEPNYPTFCGQKCHEIFQQLEVLFGVKHQLEEGFSWTLLRHCDDNLDISSTSGAKIVECNAKLAVAWSIMDECFLPIVDKRSGINMIRNVVHSCGSNIRRLNYTGFFVVILERGDEIISAATLRIHGSLLAEMPFIGTRYTYRRQGMCRRLLTAIETALCSISVEKLVLPAVAEVRQTWTSVFGFMPLVKDLSKEIKCMNMIAFPGVDMLQKPVTKQPSGVENSSSATDVISSGTADVAEIGNPTSHVLSVSSNETMTSELVDYQGTVTIDENESKKEAPSQLKDVYVSNEINKIEDIPSGTCEVASNENFDEQKDTKVADRTVISEAVSDTLKCETNVKEIVGCVQNGEVNAINHSRDQHVVNDHNASSQALVLV